MYYFTIVNLLLIFRKVEKDNCYDKRSNTTFLLLISK